MKSVAETTNLTVLANSPMVPAARTGPPVRPVSRGRRRGSRTTAADADHDDGQHREARVADESRALAGAARIAAAVPGLGEAAVETSATTSQPPARRRSPTRRRRLTRRRRRWPATQRRAPMSTTPPARQATATSGRRRSPPVRTRIASDALERGQDQRATQTGGQPRRAGVVEAGHADHDRHARPTRPARPGSRTGVAGAVPGGTRSARSAAVADGFARDDDEPDVERGVVDGDRVEALADLERRPAPGRPRTTTHPSRPDLQTGPPEDERAVGVVLELVLGIDPSADLDVARPARSAERSCLGRR